MDFAGSMDANGKRHFDVARAAGASDKDEVAAVFGSVGVGGKKGRERGVDVAAA